ncbi:zf-HC2 domain-containing protein [bacterium]|nr:zf-HC2 domain-containing protein [bacterium]
MDENFTCSQIETLMNYYIEGKLAPSLVKYMQKHLDKCEYCNQKFKRLHQQQNHNIKSPKANSDNTFLGSLSAYIDNELDTYENVKIKKMTISNPTARQKLESMYKFQKLMHSAYEKTKNDTKIDYSKNIIALLDKSEDYTTPYFRNIILMFLLLFIAIICGFVYLYF